MFDVTFKCANAVANDHCRAHHLGPKGEGKGEVKRETKGERPVLGISKEGKEEMGRKEDTGQGSEIVGETKNRGREGRNEEERRQSVGMRDRDTNVEDTNEGKGEMERSRGESGGMRRRLRRWEGER